jgi:pyruvate,water dikinase
MALVQHAVKEIGRRLVDRDILTEMEEFYFLDLDEARAALLGGGEFVARARERRADNERWSRMNPPRYLGTLPADGAPEDAAEAIAALEIERSQLLRGEAASAGAAAGPARIVKSPAEFGKVRPGDVLVCRSTSATWTPLFDIVSGLVSEAGGILSHPAVVAREYGLPAVVGVHRATELISDGEPVRIDGAAGTVQLA